MCQVEQSPVRLQHKGEYLYIEMDMNIHFLQVGDNESRMCVSLLTDGSKQIELPVVLIAGKNRYWTLKRSLWGLGGNRLKIYKIKNIIKAVNFTSIHYCYRTRLHYEAWMEKAALNLYNQK
jgi:hypothetical protein